MNLRQRYINNRNNRSNVTEVIEVMDKLDEIKEQGILSIDCAPFALPKLLGITKEKAQEYFEIWSATDE